MTLELDRLLDPAFSEGTDALVRGLEGCRLALEAAGFSGDREEALAAAADMERLFEGLAGWMERLPAAVPRLAPILRDTVEGWIVATGEADTPAAARAAQVVQWLDRDPQGTLHRIVQRFADVIDSGLRDALVAEVRARAGSAEVVPDGRGMGVADWLGLEYVLKAESDDVDAWRAVADAEGDQSAGRRVWECLSLAEAGRIPEALEVARQARQLPDLPDAWLMRVAVLEEDALRTAGREHEAFDAVFAAASAQPGASSLARLRRLVRHPERSAAVVRAVGRAEAGSGPIERCILLLALADVPRLAQELGRLPESEFQKLSPFVVRESVALVESDAPLVAARLHLRLGMLDADEVSLGAQSRAMESFDAARRCFERAGEPRRWRETLDRLFERYDRNPMFGRVFRARFRPDGRPTQRPGPAPGSAPRPPGSNPAAPGTPGDGPIRPEVPRSFPAIRPRGSGSAPAVFVRGGGTSREQDAGSGPPKPPAPVTMPPSLSGIRNLPTLPVPGGKAATDRASAGSKATAGSSGGASSIDERAFEDRPPSSVRRRAIRRDEDGNPVVIRRRVQRDDDT